MSHNSSHDSHSRDGSPSDMSGNNGASETRTAPTAVVDSTEQSTQPTNQAFQIHDDDTDEVIAVKTAAREALMNARERNKEELEMQRQQQQLQPSQQPLAPVPGATTLQPNSLVQPAAAQTLNTSMLNPAIQNMIASMDPQQAQVYLNAYQQQVWAYNNAQPMMSTSIMTATPTTFTTRPTMTTTWGQNFSQYANPGLQGTASAARFTNTRTATSVPSTNLMTSNQQEIPQHGISNTNAPNNNRQRPVVTQPGTQNTQQHSNRPRDPNVTELVDLTGDPGEVNDAPTLPPRNRVSNDARIQPNSQESRWRFYNEGDDTRRPGPRSSLGQEGDSTNNSFVTGDLQHNPERDEAPAGYDRSRARRRYESGTFLNGRDERGHPNRNDRDDNIGGRGMNIQNMLADLERRMTNQMEQQLAALNIRGQGAPIDDRIPTFTDLSTYPDIDPSDPRARRTDLNAREYRIIDFKGGSSNSSGVASSCKSFLQDIVETGKHHNLTHKQCIRLINRHTLEEPKDIVSNEIRDPECTLESVVRALELRYMHLVYPDTAKAQMYQIIRQPNEDLHSLKNRLSDRAQMACRKLAPEEKLAKEQMMVKERFMALLSPTVRNILRERDRMRESTGRQAYGLLELVEEAIAVETEQNDDIINQKGSIKSVSFPSIPKSSLYHEQKQPRLPSPPPQQENEYRPRPQFANFYTTEPPWEYSDEDSYSNNSNDVAEDRCGPVVLLTSPGRKGEQFRTIPVRKARNGEVLSIASRSDRTSNSNFDSRSRRDEIPRRDRFRDDTPAREQTNGMRYGNDVRFQNWNRSDSRDRARGWSDNWGRSRDRPEGRDRISSSSWNRDRGWQNDWNRDRFRSTSRDRGDTRWQGNNTRFQDRRGERYNDYRGDNRGRDWRENRSGGQTYTRDWSRERPSRGWYEYADRTIRSDSRDDPNRWYGGRRERSSSRDRSSNVYYNGPPPRRPGNYNSRFDNSSRNDRQYQGNRSPSQDRDFRSRQPRSFSQERDFRPRGFSQERDFRNRSNRDFSHDRDGFRNRPPTPDSRNNFDKRSNEGDGRGRSFERQNTGERGRSAEREIRPTPQSARVEEGSCLRCGKHNHDTSTCPTYGLTPLADTYCYRCKRGSHLSIYCKEDIAPQNNEVKN